MKTRHLSLPAIFALPVGLAVLSLTGLVGALLEDGAWDLIGSGLLATSVVAIVLVRMKTARR